MPEDRAVIKTVRKYARRRSIESKVREYLSAHSPELTDHADRDMIYHELLELANETIDQLPHKRKIVYKLSRQKG
ncbi:MAG: hypothetical protein R6U78_14360 [Bacteroidales bacterium]